MAERNTTSWPSPLPALWLKTSYLWTVSDPALGAVNGEDGVVDVDWYIEADQPKARFIVDKEKAALHGISAETISQTLAIAVGATFWYDRKVGG